MPKFNFFLLNMVYYFLILFFAYTAMNKLMGFQSFQTNLLKTGLFSNKIIPIFATFVIILELGVLVLLIFFKSIGTRALLIMLLLFTIYISFLNVLGRYEVCGCGGVLNGLKFQYHLLINILLIALTIILLINQKKQSNEA